MKPKFTVIEIDLTDLLEEALAEKKAEDAAYCAAKKIEYAVSMDIITNIHNLTEAYHLYDYDALLMLELVGSKTSAIQYELAMDAIESPYLSAPSNRTELLTVLAFLTERAPWLIRFAVCDDALFNSLMKAIGYLLVMAKRITRQEAGLDQPEEEHHD